MLALRASPLTSVTDVVYHNFFKILHMARGGGGGGGGGITLQVSDLSKSPSTAIFRGTVNIMSSVHHTNS